MTSTVLSLKKVKLFFEFETRTINLLAAMKLNPRFPLKNKPFEQFINELIKSPHLASLLSSIKQDCARQTRQLSNTPTTACSNHTVRSVIEFLDKSGIDAALFLLPSNSPSHPTTPLSPTIATAQHSVPLPSISAPPKPPVSFADQQTHDKLKTLSDDHLNKVKSSHPHCRPIIAAIHQRRTCDACGGNGHLADSCFKRGVDFLPPSEQKCIKQCNLTHGDKPKEPPHERVPKPPAPHFKDSSPQQQPTPKITNIRASPPVLTDAPLSATTLEARHAQAFANGNPPAAEQVANSHALMSEFHSDEDPREDNNNHTSTSTDPPSVPVDQSTQATTSSDTEFASNPAATEASSVSSTPFDSPTPFVNNIASRVDSCPVCSEPGHVIAQCPALISDIPENSTGDDHVFVSDDYDSSLSPYDHHLAGSNC